MTDVSSALALSLRVALWATAVNFVVGLWLAWLLAFGRFRGRQALDVLVNLPVALPPTVLGYYLLLLMARNGPVGRLTHSLGLGTLIFTPTAAVIAASLVSLPFFVQAARTSLEEVPSNVLEAAMMDGAGPWEVFRYILLPLAWPGIVTGALLSFARALGEFGATLMVAGNIPGRTQTIPIAIYSAVQAGRMDEANRLALVLVAVVAVSTWAGLRWRRRFPEWLPLVRVGSAGRVPGPEAGPRGRGRARHER